MLKRFLKFIKLHTRLISIILIISLIGLFILSNQKDNATEITQPTSPKEVEIYSPTSASIEAIGEVIESGKVEIKAQVGGVVRRVKVNPGQKVLAGNNIFEISQSYGTSSPALTQSAIAYKQYQLAKDTYDQQLAAIADQKRLAELNSENAAEQRNISESALNDTNRLVENSESSLEDLKNNNANGSLDDAIAGVEATLAQLKASQRNLAYGAGDDNPPAKIAQTSKDLTIKQLEIQEKSLETQLEIARLSSVAASQSAASFLPSSPINGYVEAIFVGENQTVTPGQTLAVIYNNSSTLKISTSISSELFEYFDKNSDSTIFINDNSYLAKPIHVSAVPTKGMLHSIIFEIPEFSVITSNFVKIKLPFVTENHSTFLVPLEALHQTQNSNYLYVVEDNLVIGREVEIGSLQGGFVEIKSGVEVKEKIITTRNVSVGDQVMITN